MAVELGLLFQIPIGAFLSPVTLFSKVTLEVEFDSSRKSLHVPRPIDELHTKPARLVEIPQTVREDCRERGRRKVRLVFWNRLPAGWGVMTMQR